MDNESIEYKPNSQKYKQEQQQKQASENRPKFKKITTGKVKTRKNEVRNFKDVFLTEDVDTVKSYVLSDVLIPRIKDMIADILIGTVNMFFYGRADSRKGNSSISSKISYRDYYGKKDEGRDPIGSIVSKTGYSYDDITLDSRAEAEEVLDRLDEAVKAYGMVSVADLYELVGVPAEYTDYKYGWFNLRNSSVERVRDGYLIKLPKAMPLK